MVNREGLELLNDSSLWGPFITEDMTPDEALHQQQNPVTASLSSQEHNVQRWQLNGLKWNSGISNPGLVLTYLNEWHKPNMFGIDPEHNLSCNTPAT